MLKPAFAAPLRFVVQKHAARTLHYDFRLERDGVFKSWAVPKGVPERSGQRRLAVQVEDHTLEFGDFEGTIAEGEYGAGVIEIWDRGTYDILDWQEDNVLFSLHGQRHQGRFRIIRFPRGGARAWLLMKCPEPYGVEALHHFHGLTDASHAAGVDRPRGQRGLGPAVLSAVE